MFTKNLSSSTQIKIYFNDGEPSGVPEEEGEDKPTDKPTYTPPTENISSLLSKEKKLNMSQAPKALMNSLALEFGGDPKPEMSKKVSYKPDIILDNGKTGAEQTIANIEKTQEENATKLAELKSKVINEDSLNSIETPEDKAKKIARIKEIDELEAENKIMRTAIDYQYDQERQREQARQNEREYDQWAKEQENEEQENLQKQYQSEISRDDDGYSAIQQAKIEARSERIDTFLGAETDSANIVIQKTPSGYCLFKENGKPIEDPLWQNFQTQRQANRAEIRYRLFSQPPLDVIRDKGPQYINQLLQDKGLKNIWNQENLGEPFTAKGLRRLLLVALLKEMNPVYKKLSYNEILKWRGQSLQSQFNSEFLTNSSKLGLYDESKAFTDIPDKARNENLWKIQ